jgi:hypothetical protein
MEAVGITAQAVSSEVTGKILPVEKLYQHDPLLVLLRDRLHLNEIWSILGIAFFTGIVLIGLPILTTPNFDPLGVSLLVTLRVVVQTLILFPLLYGIYLLLPGYIANMFNTLQENGIVGEYRKDRTGAEAYEAFLQKLVSWADNSWWTVAALVFVAVCWLYELFVAESFLYAAALPPLWLRILTLLVYTPIMYAVFLNVVRLLVILIFTNWLFHLYTIHLNPLDPDGSAGLGKLGTMLSISMLLMGTMGVTVLVVIHPEFLSGNLPASYGLQLRVQAVLFGIMYFVLTAGLVIGWLSLPHQVMREARDETLKPLADEFEYAIADTMPSSRQDANAIKAGTDRLAELKRRYELLQDTYPTWPLAIEQVRRLVATVSLPALIPLALPFIKDFIVFIGNAFGHH